MASRTSARESKTDKRRICIHCEENIGNCGTDVQKAMAGNGNTILIVNNMVSNSIIEYVNIVNIMTIFRSPSQLSEIQRQAQQTH